MKDKIYKSLMSLDAWVQKADWKGYDTFDGLSSPLSPYLTFNHPFLKQCWQQGVRRFPINLRPVLGIKPAMSTKGMGFFAAGYLKLYHTHGQAAFLEKAKYCLQWLMENRCPQFKGAAWANHFHYQSRDGSIPKGLPTIVWTGLITHAFLDAYEILGDVKYLDVARSACDFIVEEQGWLEFEEGILLRYHPGCTAVVHNASMIGASVLARTHSFTPNQRHCDLAERAVKFTVHHQQEDGGWKYGVGPKYPWIDNFHTAYVLESLDIFIKGSGATQYEAALKKGYRYWIETFFLPDGTPKYYHYKTSPIDIQCASQAIQSLIHMRRLHPDSVETAKRVANWTIDNMQDRSGYFYYRKYPGITNKTPTLHWGQATMFAGLAMLDQHLNSSRPETAAKQAAVVA